MGRHLLLLGLLLAAAGCASFPEGAYYAESRDPSARVLAEALYRVARAADDEPARYSFAMIRTRSVAAYVADDGVLYLSEGLARQPLAHVEAIIAHEVAHEALGHAGQRSSLWLGLSGGFTVLGVMVPGLSLADLVINPLVIRAFRRDQEIAADLKAVEILRDLGYPAPRRTMAEALQAAAKINGPPPGGIFAVEPPLAERLAALEPLEPVTLAGPPPLRPR